MGDLPPADFDHPSFIRPHPLRIPPFQGIAAIFSQSLSVIRHHSHPIHLTHPTPTPPNPPSSTQPHLPNPSQSFDAILTQSLPLIKRQLVPIHPIQSLSFIQPHFPPTPSFIQPQFLPIHLIESLSFIQCQFLPIPLSHSMTFSSSPSHPFNPIFQMHLIHATPLLQSISFIRHHPPSIHPSTYTRIQYITGLSGRTKNSSESIGARGYRLTPPLHERSSPGFPSATCPER